MSPTERLFLSPDQAGSDSLRSGSHSLDAFCTRLCYSSKKEQRVRRRRLWDVDPTQANDVGGRQKGTPNRHTRTVQEKLEAVGCDPIEGMARLAMDEQTDLAIRARLYAELAQYVAPKRKALDVTVEDQRPPYAELLDLMRSGKLNEVAATTGWQPQTHPLRERNEG